MLIDHNLIEVKYKDIIFEKRPCLDNEGKPVEGLYNAWIFLNNPKQYNSYTTQAVKEVILAFREASNDRSVVAVVFTRLEIRHFVQAVIQKNMLSITQEIRRNINSTCGFLMIWFPQF